MVEERRGFRRLSRTVLLSALLVASALIAMLFLMLIDDRGFTTATLPDGTKIKFLGICVGRGEFTTERKWVRFARRVLPPKLENLLPDGFTASGMLDSTNSITVYFSVPKSASGSRGKPLPWSRVVPEDDTGFRYEKVGSFGGSSQSGYDFEISSFGLASFPRRQRDFWLRLLDDTGKTIASFRVKNPFAGNFSEWDPLLLPQTCTNGLVKLVFESLELSLDGATRLPNWRLETGDPRWQSAWIDYPKFSDCTGNEGFPLSPAEKTWKIRTKVTRQHPEDFAASEKVTFANIIVPVSGTYTSVDQVAKCGECEIKFLVFAPAGEFGISNGVTRFVRSNKQASGFTHNAGSSGVNSYESWSAAEPFILVEIRNYQNEDQCLFSCRDDSESSSLPKMGYPGYTSTKQGSRIYYSTITLRPGTKSIDVEVMVNRPLEFEFLLDPKDRRITRRRFSGDEEGK